MEHLMKKVIVSIFLFTMLCTQLALANNLSTYTSIKSNPGWGLWYKAEFLGDVYVQRINMKHADVSLVTGKQTNNSFNKSALTSYWSTLNSNFGAYSVSNAAFFESLSGNSTELSFPLKLNNSVKTMGVSLDGVGLRKILAVKNTCANGYKCAFVLQYSDATFSSSNYQTAMVGLDPYFDKNALIPLGRTFVGVDHSDPNNLLMYIVHGTRHTQGQMRTILNNLGVYDNAMIMFDGSGSSQLAFLNKDNQNQFVYGFAGSSRDYRAIPQVIVVTPK